MDTYGILTLLPPLVAISLCFITKQVLFSLFVGIWTAATIMSNFNPLTGTALALDTIVENITDPWNAKLLLFTFFMGVGITFIWRLGGSLALTDYVKRRIKTRRGICLGTWILGMLTSLNDCLVAAVTGNVFRDVCKEYRISSEKFSYVLDSTAAPAAAVFISDWIAYQIGMIATGLAAIGVSASATAVYVKSIPYNLYSIFTLIFVGMLMYRGKDYGPVLEAENRTLTTGQYTAPGSQPMLNVESDLGEPIRTNPKIRNFVLPIVSAIAVILFGLYWTGREGEGILGVLEQADASTALLWGSFTLAIVGFILALTSKLMNFEESMNCFVDGFKLMMLTASILAMAWSLSSIVQEMGLAGYIVSLVGSNVPLWIIVILVFLLSMLVSFATGTSWGTMAIMTPLAINLVYQTTGNVEDVSMIAGLVLSGAIVGDHCSPISDTTVMASIYSGADHIAHVKTQLPYALTTAFIVLCMHILNAITGCGPLVMIPIGIVMIYVLQTILSKIAMKRRGISYDISALMKDSADEVIAYMDEFESKVAKN